VCNKRKSSDVGSFDPETGNLVPLFHPRRDGWQSHFQLRGFQIDPLTAVGRVTVRLLQLNHPDRIAERELLVTAGVWDIPAG
jgi:hypothetical protein